jgi:hypothetical protein
MNIFGFKRMYRVCLPGDFFAFTLLAFLLLAGPAIGQQGYQRYGRVYINTHGSAIPASLAQYIAREGELLVTKYRAIGITVPNDFHYKIDFLPDFKSYQRYSASKDINVGPGTLGFNTSYNQVNRITGDHSKPPQFPTEIVCYWLHDMPWEIVPTLLHEMCHSVHAADYGVMPVWLSEGLPEWYSNRKQHLGVSKKIDTMNQFQHHMERVQNMTEKQFVEFIAATKYEEWEALFGNTAIGYFLAQSLVDFFLGNPSAQLFFRSSLHRAKTSSEWQRDRTLHWARNVQANWPGGIPMLLKGWKNWYKLQAQPKLTNHLNPFVDTNRERFHQLLAVVRAKPAAASTEQYALVIQWLAFARLEMDDLKKKRAESYHLGETAMLRARQLRVERFAAKDHAIRSLITKNHRDHLVRTRFNAQDPLYKKTVPYQPLSWYLGLDPTQGSHDRPPFMSNNRLPHTGFKWKGLDAWQASIIYTNLISSNIGQPVVTSGLKMKRKAQGPFSEALRKNSLNAEAAIRAVGGKLERHAITGEVLTLNLAHTLIDNDDLEHLAVLFQPRELDLTDTEITDAAAQHLSGWASLRVLRLSRTRITQAAVNDIKYYSPGLVIR